MDPDKMSDVDKAAVLYDVVASTIVDLKLKSVTSLGVLEILKHDILVGIENKVREEEGEKECTNTEESSPKSTTETQSQSTST